MQPVPVGSCILSTMVLLNLLWPMQDPAKAEQKRQVSTDFGTYDAAVQSCNLNDNGVRQPCSRVQLTQRGEEGLRIRFIGAGEQPGTSLRVTFIARQPGKSRLLSCHQALCRPIHGQWSADVISASTTRFNVRGLPDALPRAMPMRGTCELDESLIRCESQGRGGINLSAQARF